MEKALFLYSSHDGQTIKIMKYIEKIYGEEFECDWINLATYPKVDFSLYNKVVVGAAIRYGFLHKSLYRFIEQYQRELGKHEAAFFCVNLTARKEGKDKPENSVYMQTFLKKSPWKPKYQAVFAGALRYPRYKWLDKVMIQFIMKITKGETDTSKEVEYTNWSKVKAFALLTKGHK